MQKGFEDNKKILEFQLFENKIMDKFSQKGHILILE